MAFRQFIPEMSLSSLLPYTNHSNIQNQPSFLNNFGVNLNPYPYSRNIQHNNETIENIKINIVQAQSDQLNNNPNNQLSIQKVSKLNDRQRQYKRSTNNSHKKFICIAKRLLMRFLSNSEKKRFDTDFQIFKNSRVYYFIILAHAKILLSSEDLSNFTHQFLQQMNNKIESYKKQISQTSSNNLINYRYDQIADLQFAVQAFDLYFKDNTLQAIEVIYKRDKSTVVKKNHYEQTIKIINQLEYTLKNKEVMRNSKHNVIILKQDTLYFNYDQPRIEEKSLEEQKSQNLDPFSFGCKQKTFLDCKEKEIESKEQMILLQLQKSYPIYDYFYEIMFPYSMNPPPMLNLPVECAYNKQPLDYFTHFHPIQQQQIFGQADQTTINKFFLSKTRSDEGIDNKHLQYSP